MDSFCLQVTDSDFENTVLSSERPVLVDFWSPQCGPCLMLMPVIEKLAKEYHGDVDVVKVNLTENPQLAAQLQIRSVPHLMVFRNGEIIDEQVGAPPPERILQMLESALG